MKLNNRYTLICIYVFVNILIFGNGVNATSEIFDDFQFTSDIENESQIKGERIIPKYGARSITMSYNFDLLLINSEYWIEYHKLIQLTPAIIYVNKTKYRTSSIEKNDDYRSIKWG